MKKVLVQLPILSLLCLTLAMPTFAEGNGRTMDTNGFNGANRGIGTYGTYDPDTTNGKTDMYRYYQQDTRNNGMFGTNNNRMNGNFRARATATDTNDTNWSWLGLLGLLGLAGMFRGTNNNNNKSRT